MIILSINQNNIKKQLNNHANVVCHSTLKAKVIQISDLTNKTSNNKKKGIKPHFHHIKLASTNTLLNYLVFTAKRYTFANVKFAKIGYAHLQISNLI